MHLTVRSTVRIRVQTHKTHMDKQISESSIGIAAHGHCKPGLVAMQMKIFPLVFSGLFKILLLSHKAYIIIFGIQFMCAGETSDDDELQLCE